ncbi:MAG: amidohydrolase family protein [Filimonas sp.]|nr:amidohydrolase family protein [Filimonas sp.]
MQRIDAHQHFWRYNAKDHAWITDEMSVIRRDFLPADLLPLLQQQSIDGCVAVQADQSAAENEFLLQLAGENDWIKAVIGWIDFKAADIDDQLAGMQQHTKLKGFRHILQGEADDAYMLQPAFLNGINKLVKYNYTYDILVFPRHLENVAKFVNRFPNQPFVIDHLAKPYIKNKAIGEWESDLRKIAAFDNVSCKVSGIITEADWQHWTQEDIKPYLDVVFNAFGTKRIMFGSDWPVCLVAGAYAQVAEIIDNYLSGFSDYEKQLVWGGNASQFYNL